MALLPPYVVRHLVMLTIVSAAYLLNFPTNAATAVTAVAAALMLTVCGQTFVLNRKLARAVPPGPKAYEVKTWFSVSLPILIVEGFYLLLTNVDIVMLQHFRSPDDVAVYYAAAKTLALITFVHFAVSAAVGHRFSEYHVTRDHDRLNSILARHTGQPIDKIKLDTDRDNFMGGASAVKYGIIDHVLETRGDLPMEAVAKT